MNKAKIERAIRELKEELDWAKQRAIDASVNIIAYQAQNRELRREVGRSNRRAAAARAMALSEAAAACLSVEGLIAGGWGEEIARRCAKAVLSLESAHETTLGQAWVVRAASSNGWVGWLTRENGQSQSVAYRQVFATREAAEAKAVEWRESHGRWHGFSYVVEVIEAVE